MSPILASRTSAQWPSVAFPDQLDEVEAAALLGAFVGAVSGALQVLGYGSRLDPETLRDRLNRATTVAFRPWT